MKVNVELEDRSLAYMISGLYLWSQGIDEYAIPSELYILVAQELSFYLKDWDYSSKTIEDWICEDLIIYPKELLDIYFSKEDYEDNPIHIKYNNGAVVLIATAKVYCK